MIIGHNRFLLLLSLVYSLLFNLYAFFIQTNNDALAITWMFLLSLAYVFLFFMVLSLQRRLFAVVTVVAFFINSVITYFVLSLKIYFNPQIVALLFETNVHEATGLIGPRLVLWSLFHVSVAIASVVYYLKNVPRIPARDKLIVIAPLLCVVPVLFWADFHEFGPHSIYQNTYLYLVRRNEMREISRNKTNISRNSSRDKGRNQELVVVVIVGEALRADHLHINGYHRETTPNIEKLHFVSYPDTTACDTSTRISIPCMLTRATEKNLDRIYKETSFISIFRELGFYTAWISNQGTISRNMSLTTTISEEAEHSVFNNKTGSTYSIKLLDEELLPAVDAALKNENPDKLIIIHTVGSHWVYDSHYPEDFRIFTPTCAVKPPSICNQQDLINSYDNTVLYTDHFLKEIVRRLEGRNALLWYTSDHGESLGEDGYYLHLANAGRPEQKKVPFLVWASEKFRINNEPRYAMIIKHQGKPISHDNLFHSVVDCAGIQSPLVEKNLSLCEVAN